MDMFLFQLAFIGESVEADVQAVRTVRYKRGLLDGEHCNYKARIQLWKEEDNAAASSGASSKAPSIAGTFRSRPNKASILKIHSTRLVMYFDEIIMTLFSRTPLRLCVSRGYQLIIGDSNGRYNH